MLHKTEGIVLSSVKFRESSLIVKIFTSEFGLLSYIVNGVRTAKPKFHSSTFMPLSVVELVSYYSPNKEIQRFSEIKLIQVSNPITNYSKTCIELFLSEILNKLLKDTGPNFDLFQYIKNELVAFKNTEDFTNFHLMFLIGLTTELGIDVNESDVINSLKLSEDELTIFKTLVEKKQVECNRTIRVRLLNLLIEYFNEHHYSVGKLHSIEILTEILD